MLSYDEMPAAPRTKTEREPLSRGSRIAGCFALVSIPLGMVGCVAGAFLWSVELGETANRTDRVAAVVAKCPALGSEAMNIRVGDESNGTYQQIADLRAKCNALTPNR